MDGVNMIKGKYVALIEMDFHIDEDNGSFIPYPDFKDGVMNGKMRDYIYDLIREDFSEDEVDITVTQQYADLYQVGDSDADD
jgi:hypothetical protein